MSIPDLGDSLYDMRENKKTSIPLTLGGLVTSGYNADDEVVGVSKQGKDGKETKKTNDTSQGIVTSFKKNEKT